LRSDVHEIPPIELPYFDTVSGKYRIAKSAPIPIKVKFSKVVTAADAEGIALPAANGNAVESWSQGIAHNYDGAELLKSEHYGFCLRTYPKSLLVLIILPPVIYILVLIILLFLRYRANNSPAIIAKKAFSNLVQSVKSAVAGDNATEMLLNSLQEYLASKLGLLDHGVLTFGDVQGVLAKKMVDVKILDDLKELFNECEAGHFGGGVAGNDLRTLGDRIIDFARSLEKELKKS
jgi:hypothetical protein